MAAKFTLLLLVAVLGPSLSVAFSHLPDYDEDYYYGSSDVSTMETLFLVSRAKDLGKKKHDSG